MDLDLWAWGTGSFFHDDAQWQARCHYEAQAALDALRGSSGGGDAASGSGGGATGAARGAPPGAAPPGRGVIDCSSMTEALLTVATDEELGIPPRLRKAAAAAEAAAAEAEAEAKAEAEAEAEAVAEAEAEAEAAAAAAAARAGAPADPAAELLAAVLALRAQWEAAAQVRGQGGDVGWTDAPGTLVGAPAAAEQHALHVRAHRRCAPLLPQAPHAEGPTGAGAAHAATLPPPLPPPPPPHQQQQPGGFERRRGRPPSALRRVLPPPQQPTCSPQR
jgi:hypothetical protein